MLVVKFHRNNCYRTDLSGEYGTPGKTLQSCRNDEDEIVTSNVDKTSGALSNISLAAGADPQEFNFVLANPLPVNATDVRFQVVFRGQVGADKDVVAIGTKDVPEPTFYSWINNTDSLFCYSGGWYKRNADGTLPQVLIDAGYSSLPATYTHVGLSFQQSATKPYATLSGSFDHPLLYPLVTVENLPPGHFIRVAVLAEDQAPFTGDVTGYGYPDTVGFDMEVNQAVFSVDGINLKSAVMQTVQGINTFRYNYAYEYGGDGDCEEGTEPKDMASYDGGTFQPRVQDPLVIVDSN